MQGIDDRNRVILICGMHRSGTSLVAHMLMDAGVPFGTPLLDSPVADNVEGYGEHSEVVSLHEALLDQLGRTWHRPVGVLPLPVGWQDWPEARAATARLRAVIAHQMQGRSLWAVKDPRISRLLPMWMDVLGEMGLAPSVIVCVRHPDGVAQSLEARNRMPRAQAYDTYRAHHLDIAETVRAAGAPAIHVDYDALIARPESVFGQVLEGLGLDCPSPRLAAVAGRVRPELRHHVRIGGASDEARPHADLDKPRSAALWLYRSLSGSEGDAADPALPEARPEPVSGLSVSVVIRTRNRGLFLARALRSVLAQTYPRWHAVIVNDGGDPGEVAGVLQPYLPAFRGRVSRIDLADRAGMEAASNRGIFTRNDDCIAIHDDDDSWAPDFLERGVQRLQRSGATGVVTGSVVVEERTEGDRIVETGRRPFGSEGGTITLPEMAQHNRFPPIAFLFRRSLYQAVGPYREDLPVLGDWEFNIRALRFAPLDVLPEPLAHWHRRPHADANPNSDDALHRAVERRLRDEWARAASPLVLLTGGLRRDIEHALAQTRDEIAEAVTARVEQHMRREDERVRSAQAAARCSPAFAAPSRTREPGCARGRGDGIAGWSLSPVGRVNIAGEVPVGRQESLGDDPQLLYALPEPLPPGRYWAECQLSLPASTEEVELFYSPTPAYEQLRSIRLLPMGDDIHAGVFDAADSTAHLRVDPMPCAGVFSGGTLTVRTVPRGGPRLPDFLCIGAQRSGTTWLHHALSAHPGLYLPPCKELHALDDMAGIDRQRWAAHRLDFLSAAQAAATQALADRSSPAWRTLAWAGRFATSPRIDMEWYRSLFTDAEEGQLAGEITPSYAVLPERAVARAVAAMPGLQVFFLMRDPVERSLSGALHECTTASKQPGRPAMDALVQALREERCTSRSAYRMTIERWERHLPPGSLHVLMFDDLVAEPARLLRETCLALGVAPPDGAAPCPGRVNENPRQIEDWPLEVLRQVAARCRDDVAWLAHRFGGHALRWAERCEQLML